MTDRRLLLKKLARIGESTALLQQRRPASRGPGQASKTLDRSFLDPQTRPSAEALSAGHDEKSCLHRLLSKYIVVMQGNRVTRVAETSR